MPRSNSSELVTLRVKVVKALREKWKKELEGFIDFFKKSARSSR